MTRRRSLLHVKRTRAKGKDYYYFRTGRVEHGKEILAPMPHIDDPGFGDSYASFMAARTRRENAAAELSVADLCELYERSPKFQKLAPGTKRLYRFSLDYFRKMLATAPARLLERKDIALLVDKRADQPGAANSLLRTINALYKWARARGHVLNDPGRDVEELDVGEHEPWPRHVLEAALEAEDDRVRLAVHLLYYTAQRIGDVVRLKGADIRDGELHVTQQKTGRYLVIKIHAKLAAELSRHDYGLGYIIPGARPGKPLHQHTLRGSLQAFAAGHGAKVVPHGLRKNAVSALLEAGCSVAETAAISGQSLGMVEMYAKGRAQGALGSAAILKWERNK